MRRAMAEAEVGDDVLDGDPTTRRLEERVAALLGMEAALFFPSGTMANQAAIWLLAERGTEVILEQDAHLIHYEFGGMAALSGAQPRPVATDDGILTAERVRAAWRVPSRYTPRIGALAVENTHNASGGGVLPVEAWDALVALSAERAVPVHLDGARLWNAAAALGVPPARLVRGATTVMVSFSKGLGCPMGSCLAGSGELMARAWEVRKRLGGGLRQSGVVAAAALYALDCNLDRLAEDHANARLLSERLRDRDGLRLVREPETNIVMLELPAGGLAADDAAVRLERRGVRVVAMGQRRLRAVTHLDVTREQVTAAADAIGDTLA
jgi:threonine aldolase